ncbi:MAG: tyrosine-type recombinase/integrase [Flavobacteriaceae bacterium]|jgi:integrase/recombinase XerC|nr:tyrosine-type recombinase/integrase [Flavobacteriaceae bacterium]MBT5394367.1 tyrosine-type recombinase/integrase [Flavobacteriaceae bacterium]MBT5584611.1 tyrosine-type recombinase/integrase [Flavobacteriaceae bacterium]MBT5922008.1 tyrosine-type recombinase/integrase [Flavobacteriaceae bacterium]MCO4779615.1 tyrosine-type recombinase/integrase [Flavobacteriaceae bacterium]|tara:strand:+ start:10181 stop:11077 length:897 start_codon:yes stop_codon:yes gene_type:complete
MPIAAFVNYLRLEKNYALNTIKAYERDLQLFQVFSETTFGTRALNEVSYSLIRSWIILLVDQGKSNVTINRKIASLNAYYNFALKSGQIAQSPLLGHKSLKVQRKIALPFSEKEMDELFSKIPFPDNFEGSRDRLIVALLYATGMRRAELIGLQTFQVDMGVLQIKVLGKRNKERVIPLIPSLVPLINAYLSQRMSLPKRIDDTHFFLLPSGKKLYETLVYRVINHYFGLVSTKVKKSPHMLRHTFATHLLNRGADMQSVKELLGHASLASTQVYTHNNMAALKKAYGNSHPRNKPKV